MGCRDKCKRLDCGANGTCVEGACACATGYDGSQCENPVNFKFDNMYALEEDCSAGADYYDLDFIPDSENPSRMLIVGLWEKESDTLEAFVNDDGLTFNIPRQVVDNVDISGTGQALDIFAIDVQIDYEVFWAGQNVSFDRCSATLSQK